MARYVCAMSTFITDSFHYDTKQNDLYCEGRTIFYSSLAAQSQYKRRKAVWAVRLILPVARPLSDYKHRALPPLDFIQVESNVITNFNN